MITAAVEPTKRWFIPQNGHFVLSGQVRPNGINSEVACARYCYRNAWCVGYIYSNNICDLYRTYSIGESNVPLIQFQKKIPGDKTGIAIIHFMMLANCDLLSCIIAVPVIY